MNVAEREERKVVDEIVEETQDGGGGVDKPTIY